MRRDEENSQMETNESPKRERYAAAEKAFVKLVERVVDVKEGDIKCLEETIFEEVLELGSILMECAMSQAKEGAPTKIVGKCGCEHHLVGYRSKHIITLLGEVEFKRPYYQCKGEKAKNTLIDDNEEEGREQEHQQCSHGSAPDDELWGVQGTRTTPGVQKITSYFCAIMTLEEAAETFLRVFRRKMSPRQALNLLKPVGNALAAQEDKKVKEIFDQGQHKASSQQEQEDLHREKTIDRLYIETDEILARMRRGSVPMEKRERNRKGDVYRGVKVGAIFQAERGREHSELAPDVFIDTPKIGSMRYVARRSAKGGFGQLLYALARQEGLDTASQVVVLGDGALWIWKLVAEHFPDAVQIVDLYHAKEHVWDVAHAVFGRATEAAALWAKQACDLLVHGKIEDLVDSIAALPAIAPEPGQSKSMPEQALGYFIHNAQRMRYPAFRAQGMHVGSGIAEAACKTVVTARLKRTGMRFTPDGLDALLPLRSSKLSGTYDQFWEPHSRLIA
jgi:hypothetical protein